MIKSLLRTIRSLGFGVVLVGIASQAQAGPVVTPTPSQPADGAINTTQAQPAPVVTPNLSQPAEVGSVPSQEKVWPTVTATLNRFDPGGFPLIKRTVLDPNGDGKSPPDVREIDPGRLSFSQTGGTYSRDLVGSAPGHFYGFCGEPLEDVSQGGTYTWNLMPLEYNANDIGTMGEAKADKIRELFGRWFPNFSASLTATQAAALQIAVWEIVRENPNNPLDVTAGSSSFAGTDPSIALAQTYLQSINGEGPKQGNLYTLTVDGVQDMIVQIPPREPELQGITFTGNVMPLRYDSSSYGNGGNGGNFGGSNAGDVGQSSGFGSPTSGSFGGASRGAALQVPSSETPLPNSSNPLDFPYHWTPISGSNTLIPPTPPNLGPITDPNPKSNDPNPKSDDPNPPTGGGNQTPIVPVPTPEPSTIGALAFGGLVALGLFLRNRGKNGGARPAA